MGIPALDLEFPLKKMSTGNMMWLTELANFDLADGIYRVQRAPKVVAPLGILLPVMLGEEPLVGLP